MSASQKDGLSWNEPGLGNDGERKGTIIAGESLNGVKPGLYKGDVSGGVSYPVLQQALAHDSLCVIQQPQQGSLLTAVITVPEDLQLPGTSYITLSAHL